MQLTIHRGSREIGGSCVELLSNKTRILVDIGLPLNIEEISEYNDSGALRKKGVLPDLKGLYIEESTAFDAVLLSQSHPDHYGLLPYIKPNIPVYASQGTIEPIKISGFFSQKGPSDRTLSPLETGKENVIGDFTVTPFLVDHSAFDALAFLIEAEGKRFFYSGYFRGNGRKA